MTDVTHILNVINRKQIVFVLYSFFVLSVSGYALPLGSSDFETALKSRQDIVYFADFENEDWTKDWTGFDGTYSVEDWGGKPNSDGTKGWSCRGASSVQSEIDGIRLGFYTYEVKSGRSNYGKTMHFDKTVTAGKWYCLEQYIKLNTPGKEDGIARARTNGVLVFEKTDFLWRNTDKLKIYSYRVDYYRGGKEPANHYHHVYLDNLVIAIGKRVGLFTPPSSSEQHISVATYDFPAITDKDTLSSDSKGLPYIATYQRPEGKEFPQHHSIYHDDNQWRIQQISRCSIISTVSNKILDNKY